MADDLNFYPMPAAEMDAALLHGYPSKAEYMCDRNFEQSRRQAFREAEPKIKEILQGRDVVALMQQDPSFVFTVVLKSPRLARVGNHENEALVHTYKRFKQKFQQFDITKYGESFSLMTCLVIWLNSILRQRLQDLRLRQVSDDFKGNYRRLQVKDPKTGKVIIDEKTGKPKTQRVKVIIGEGTINGDDGEILTLLDLIDENHQINLPKSRSAIHNRLGDKPTQAICADVMQVIENDPEGKLREIHLKNNPAINAYDILYRMYINHESLSEICRELGVAHPSVNTMVQERAYLYLAQWVLNHREGYEPETLRQVVEANPNGILTKFKAAMRDQSDHRCAHAHVQYFARQFCSCFGQVRSFADVTLELTTKYQYNITPAMVEEFWRTTGTEKLAKAVRLFKVNSHSEKD